MTYATPDFAYVRALANAREAIAKAVKAAKPGTMTLTTRARSTRGYDATLDVLTACVSGIDDERARTEDLRVVLIYGEHGREFLPVDIGVALVEALAKGEDATAALARGADEDELRRTLRRTTFTIVCVENEKGREIVERGDLCERKNGRGVDPNRNWAVDWGVKEKDYDAKEEYPGSAPFSEPESLMLKNLIEDVKPHAVVNWHSGMSALFTPYDHVARAPTGPGAEAMLKFIQKIDKAHCGGKCVLGSGGKGVGYLAHGTAADYIYDVLKVPVVYTWEVYGDDDASYEDCFRAFNPTTKEKYEKLVKDWVGAPITLVSMLLQHPDIVLSEPSVAPKNAINDGSTSERKSGFALRRSFVADAPTRVNYTTYAFWLSAAIGGCAAYVMRRRRVRRAHALNTVPNRRSTGA